MQPARTCIREKDLGIWQSWTWRQFADQVRAIACGLAAHGFKRGDHLALIQEGEGRALVRTSDGVELVSNVCRHRQAIMLQGSGNAKNIVCPIHRWTYDTGGQLIGAPHFPQNPCLNLNKVQLEMEAAMPAADIPTELPQAGASAPAEADDPLKAMQDAMDKDNKK